VIDLEVAANFPSLRNFEKHIQAALGVGVQLAAPVVQEIAREEVVIYDAFDTFALQESIYISWYGGSDYEERCDQAADAALNNPTKWPDIREWKIHGTIGGASDGSGGGLVGGGMDVIEFDPKVTSKSRYDAWIAVAASHGKFVENGYVSFYGNWVPARPFWQATADKARPVVLEILYRAMREAG
jgi:hypothetical protein